jgi:cytochrome c-type biogenesis protein CcmH/NrfF
MGLDSGEFPRHYVDPNFFTKEASQLKLTPEMAKQFKEVVQDLVGQFQDVVETAAHDLATQLAKEDPKSALVIIQAAQGKIDGAFKAFLDKTQSRLQETPGSEYAPQFVRDLQQEMAPSINLYEKMQQNPTLAPTLLPKSMFALFAGPPQKMAQVLGSEAPPKGEDPLQKYVDAITNWESQNRYNFPDSQYLIAENIKNLILSMKGQGKSVKEVIQAVDQQIYVDHAYAPPRDIYMRYANLDKTASGNLTVDQMKSLAAILSDGTNTLNTPPLTDMDRIYQQVVQWENSLDPHSTDRALANATDSTILDLGSAGSLGQLKSDAQEMINEQDPSYMNASPQAQEKFKELTGISSSTDPLHKYADAITNWESQNHYSFPSPQYRIAEDIKNLILSLEGQGKSMKEVIQAIDQQIYADPTHKRPPLQDIYMRYANTASGDLTVDQMKSLAALLSDGTNTLDTPPLTDMDRIYQQVMQWAHSLDPRSADGALAAITGKLILDNEGSTGSLDHLRDMAQAMINFRDPSYANASPQAQEKFKELTGASSPPPGSLLTWDKEITQYLQTLESEFASNLGIPISELPTTPAGWQKLAKHLKPEAAKLVEDMKLAKTPADWQQLQRKWGLPPADTQTIQQEAEARLNGYNNVVQGGSKQSALQLFTLTLQEIKSLENSKGSVTDLKKWAGSVNLANFPGLSATDILEFNKLLNL